MTRGRARLLRQARPAQAGPQSEVISWPPRSWPPWPPASTVNAFPAWARARGGPCRWRSGCRVHRAVRQLLAEESIAEGLPARPPPIALRAQRVDVKAKLIIDEKTGIPSSPPPPTSSAAGNDRVLVETGDMIPSDGEIIEGVASVNEAAITGRSAPVIRESGGDRSAVTGGTTVVSDWIKVRITAEPGNTFLDRMIAMVEGAERRKTPNELALTVLLAGLTLIFLIAVATLLGLGQYSGVEARSAGAGRPVHLSYSDNDRGLAFGDRYRRHGPPPEGQRPGHLRPRGGSLGRRRHPLARQDRHHHPWQPHGGRGYPGARRAPRTRAAGGSDGLAGRRDAGGSLDRRPGLGEGPDRRAAQGLDPRAVQRDHPPVGPRRRGPVLAQGRGGRSPAPGRRSIRPRPPPSSTPPSTGSPAPAARRWRWPRTGNWWA